MVHHAIEAGDLLARIDERRRFLLTRAHPKAEIQDDFDDWQREKHLPDLMRAPGATMVVYARNVLDGLPEAYMGSGHA